MNTFNFAMAAACGLVGFPAIAGQAEGQVGVGTGIGAAPVCPYGYYAEPPYACAPYGYYGPEWFSGGLFIGAGPWYHRGYYGGYGRGYYGYRGGFGYRGGVGYRGGYGYRGGVGVARGGFGGGHGFSGGAHGFSGGGGFHGGGGG